MEKAPSSQLVPSTCYKHLYSDFTFHLHWIAFKNLLNKASPPVNGTLFLNIVFHEISLTPLLSLPLTWSGGCPGRRSSPGWRWRRCRAPPWRSPCTGSWRRPTSPPRRSCTGTPPATCSGPSRAGSSGSSASGSCKYSVIFMSKYLMFDSDDRKLEAHKSTFLGDMTSSSC